jgi:hypothetical protein
MTLIILDSTRDTCVALVGKFYIYGTARPQGVVLTVKILLA